MKKFYSLLLIIILTGLFIGFAIFLKGALFIGTFVCLLFVVINLIWNIMPRKAKGSFQNSRWRFIGIVLACSLFFFFFGEAVNFYGFPNVFHPISITGNAAILIFTVFLGWGLVKRERKKILIIGSVIFSFLIVFLVVITSRSHSYMFQRSFEQLKSLPYLSWVSAGKSLEKRGVVLNRHAQSDQAYNIYTDDGFPDAYLIDMSGKTVHTWSDGRSRWHHVEMLENGDLLGIVTGQSIVRLDWDSNVKWSKKIPAHHDLDVAENNDIFTLIKKDELVFKSGSPLPIINDYLVVLSPDGKVKNNYSLLDIIREKLPSDLSGQVYRWWLRRYFPWRNLLKTLRINMLKLIGVEGCCYYDVFHTNTIEIIDRDIEGLCEKGNLLICVRELDLVGILDPEKEELIWSWGPGVLDRPHNPTLLENGNILVFDNGKRRTYSRIIELNPLTEQIVWSYESRPPEQFHSKVRGSCQRLPNGNTLITESNKGRVFEVTPDGDIVWEFYNPRMNMKFKTRRAIYRMTRIVDISRYPLLGRLKSQ